MKSSFLRPPLVCGVVQSLHLSTFCGLVYSNKIFCGCRNDIISVDI